MVWYDREDYDQVLRIMADADKLPETYDAWRKAVKPVVKKMKTVGQVVRVRLDPKTFPGWCAVRGLNLDANARARFAVEGAARITGNEV